ncbi:hypothetical protein ACHAXN_012637 [Cyclotella atomus]
MAKSSAEKCNVTLQGSPSIWMLAAAIQSVIWFFAIPPLLKPHWSSFFDGFSSSVAEATLFLMIIPFFLLYMLVVALPPYLLQWKCFEQYKISNLSWPWLDDRATVRDAFWKLTYKTIKLDLALVHEFFFYWTHRVFHMYPQLYKYHKVHHEYKQNNVLASQYFHPIDFILSIGGPAILTTVIVQPHSITQFQFGLWILCANFDDHLGYAFPWSPVRWFPLAPATDCHEFHHSVNMGCYSSKLILWDVIFGTDQAYRKWREGRCSTAD